MIQNLPKKVQMCNPHTIKQAGIYSNMESILNHCKHRAVRNKPRRTAWRFQLDSHYLFHGPAHLLSGFKLARQMADKLNNYDNRRSTPAKQAGLSACSVLQEKEGI